jgi:colicin import membrane protein
MATVMSTHDRPAPPRRPRGKWAALILALFVNLLFVGVLVFSVSWRNRPPEAVTAELYAPPPPTVTAPRRVEPKPQPKPEPPPPPPEPPKAVPTPPPPAVTRPDTQADIALKAKREAERLQQEQAERERVEREARQQEEARKQAEIRKQEQARKQEEIRRQEEAQKAEEKRQADLRARQQRQIETMRAQAAQESQMRTQAEKEVQMRAQAERESRMRADAEREARVRAEQAAAGARNHAQLDWIDKIRSRIRGYINLPPDIPGNPEAIFDVVQLPTGEIIDVKLRKSSGVRAYDDAVQRAILKASPLPKPVPADLFQRNLELHFRPLDQ